jgi:hypothetical protein
VGSLDLPALGFRLGQFLLRDRPVLRLPPVDGLVTSTDALELLLQAPTPEEAARLTKPQITAVLARHRRRNRDQRAAAIQSGLREPQLGVAAPVAAAYATAATAHATLLIALTSR